MSPRAALRRQHSRSGAPRARCPRCLAHPTVCPCGLFEPLELATRVVVLRHRKEVHKPTNTGRLAALFLANAELRTFGGRDEPFDARGFDDPTRRVLLLYPTDDALAISRAQHDPRPVTLVVPDADWRRTHKLATREPALLALPRVRVPDGPPSAFRLRTHPDPRFLATFESIARALGVLEGAEVRAELEQVFRTFVERTLRARGRLGADRPSALSRRAPIPMAHEAGPIARRPTA